MRIIEGRLITIARVVCDCCGNDVSHYFDLVRYRRNYDDKSNKIRYYLDFRNKSDLTLRSRIGRVYRLIKCRNEQCDSLILAASQAQEFCNVMMEDLQSDELTKKLAESVIDMSSKLKMSDFKSEDKDNEWKDIEIFRGKDDAVLVTADTFLMGKVQHVISNVNIGWHMPNNFRAESILDKIRILIRYAFKKDKYVVSEYFAELSEEDVVKFLASIIFFISEQHIEVKK